jgi:hypothetical protein
MCETLLVFWVMGLSASDDPFEEPPTPVVTAQPSKLRGSNEVWNGWKNSSADSKLDAINLTQRDRSVLTSPSATPTPVTPEWVHELPKPNVASAVAIGGEVFPQPGDVWETGLGEVDLVNGSDGNLVPAMLGDMMTRRELVHQQLASRFKIADNNSPIPSRRGLYSFNYFNNPFLQGGSVFRHSAGLEVWGFNRRASLDVRGALGTFTEPLGGRFNFPTDVTATFKVLFWDQYGFKMSAGLGTAIPVGGEPPGTRSTSFVLSPFWGWVWAKPDSRWFWHGFEQLDFPLTDDHQIILQSDIGMGYWIRQPSVRILSAMAPTAELHLYTPIGDGPGGSRTGLPFEHILNATLGITLFFGPSDSLAVGVGVPLLGERDYDLEAHLHYVRRF